MIIIVKLLFQRQVDSNTSSLQKQPPGVFCKKRCSRNFAKFTGKHLCESLFFNKVAGNENVYPFIQEKLNLLLGTFLCFIIKFYIKRKFWEEKYSQNLRNELSQVAYFLKFVEHNFTFTKVTSKYTWNSE